MQFAISVYFILVVSCSKLIPAISRYVIAFPFIFHVIFHLPLALETNPLWPSNLGGKVTTKLQVKKRKMREL